MRTRRPGFTLVELLVVITIIGILVGLITPAVLAALDRARQTECSNKLRQIGIASVAYATRKGNFPGYLNPKLTTASGGTNVSWQVALLKDLDRETIYNSWSDSTSPTYLKPNLEIYICSSDNTAAGTTDPMSSYVVNAGKSGNNTTYSRFEGLCHSLVTASTANSLKVGLTDIPDGSDLTILASENLDSDKYIPPTSGDPENSLAMIWSTGTPPYRINEEKGKATVPVAPSFARPSSNHNGQVNVVFASSATKGIDEGISTTVWNQLMSPNGTKCSPTDTSTIPEGAY